MRRSIGRPARALLPLALGALIIAGNGSRAAALGWSIIVARLFSLGVGPAFQAIGGKIVSEARLRGNFFTATIVALGGGSAAVYVLTHVSIPLFHISPISLWMALSGTMVMLTELFSERLYALTDKLSAPFCDAITIVLVTTGLVSSRGDDQILFWFALAAFCACLVAAFGIGGIRHMWPGLQIFRAIPRGLVCAWLPAALLVGMLIVGQNLLLGAFAAAGWALFSWAYAPVKRTETESGPVRILTTLGASVAVLVMFVHQSVAGKPSVALFLPIFFACLMTAYITATLGKRGEFALLFYTLATAAYSWHVLGLLLGDIAYVLPYLAAGFATLAIALILPDVATALRIAYVRLKFSGRRASG